MRNPERVCVTAGEEIDTDIFTTHEFDMHESAFSRMRTLRDFKPILILDLYSKHMPEERITGSNIDLDLYASIYGKCFININLT